MTFFGIKLTVLGSRGRTIEIPIIITIRYVNCQALAGVAIKPNLLTANRHTPYRGVCLAVKGNFGKTKGGENK